MNQRDGQFNSHRQGLADFWKRVATHPEAFLYGPVERGVTSAAEIASQISTDVDYVAGASHGDSQAAFVTLDGFLSVSHANENRNSEGGYAEFRIKSQGGHAKDNRDGWMLLHQTALSWIYANGGKWVTDDQSTPLDDLLATSIMLISALREQSTEHLHPASSQAIVNWMDGDFDNNLAALTKRESELAHERTPELANYSFDADRGRIVAADGREIKPNEIHQILARRDSQRTTGIGQATFARALATRAALRGKGGFGDDSGVALQQSALNFGETTPL
jgi:hypothetical protein